MMDILEKKQPGIRATTQEAVSKLKHNIYQYVMSQEHYNFCLVVGKEKTELDNKVVKTDFIKDSCNKGERTSV